MKRLLPLLALIAVVSAYGGQQRVTIGAGFFTGKEYLDMTGTERRAYAIGAMNGMLVAPFFGAPDANLNWLKTCTGKMSDEQIAGLITRYIQDDPKQLQLNLNVVTFSAIREACKNR